MSHDSSFLKQSYSCQLCPQMTMEEGDYSLPEASLFLGLDCSTQSLKATVLDANLVIVATEFVHFDSELPHYKTQGGVYRDPLVDGRIVSPPLMWVEALDVMLERLSKTLDLAKIVSISGSAQQHGSVYWKNGSSRILSSLDPEMRLVDQLREAFSLKESPIWMDSSTTEQCRKIEEALGGALELHRLTGSRAHERYVGPQVQKLYEKHPEIYHDTERISLVSSFMGSLLIGGYACIDETDGAGMNLMDIKEKKWSNEALQATAPYLEERLGELAPANAVSGYIAPYFTNRFKFSKSCMVIQWSGDNPNSLAGLCLETGDLAISLGTSDTVFGITDEPQPCLESHVFPNPVDTKGYMVMLVYKNGSLTREDVRNRYAEKSWEIFNDYLQQTPPLNGGKMGFYYKEHEILPPLPVGFHRYILKNFTGDSLDGIVEQEVDKFDAPSEIRALIEGQLLSMRAHAERVGMLLPPKRLVVTGGASSNECILATVASLFGADVHTVPRPDSASLGAALRAAHGWLCNEKGSFVPVGLLYDGKMEKTSFCSTLCVSAGDRDFASKYAVMMRKRVEIEDHLVSKFGRL